MNPVWSSLLTPPLPTPSTPSRCVPLSVFLFPSPSLTFIHYRLGQWAPTQLPLHPVLRPLSLSQVNPVLLQAHRHPDTRTVPLSALIRLSSLESSAWWQLLRDLFCKRTSLFIMPHFALLVSDCLTLSRVSLNPTSFLYPPPLHHRKTIQRFEYCVCMVSFDGHVLATNKQTQNASPAQ